MPSKADLRRLMRERLALPPDLRAQLSASIRAAIVALPAWQRARTVALFAPQAREPDVDGLWEVAGSRRFVYPRAGDDGLTFYAIDSLFELQPGRWGVREPAPLLAVSPTDIDLVLVPGVAFTRAGARCGRGGGYYDRFLATLPTTATKAGVCFAFQMVDEIPVEPHDCPVDFVLTDRPNH